MNFALCPSVLKKLHQSICSRIISIPCKQDAQKIKMLLLCLVIQVQSPAPIWRNKLWKVALWLPHVPRYMCTWVSTCGWQTHTFEHMCMHTQRETKMKSPIQIPCKLSSSERKCKHQTELIGLSKEVYFSFLICPSTIFVTLKRSNTKKNQCWGPYCPLLL